MEKCYKFRLYLTKEQEELITKMFGYCRFVWNHYLAMRNELYIIDSKTFGYNDCCKDLTQLKKSLEWLKEADSTALQSSLRYLDNAFKNYFRRSRNGEESGYPQFKSKHNKCQSYTSRCVGTNIKVLDKAVQLPKLGIVKCRISKKVKGRILSATVSRNKCGKYFVSICCTDVDIEELPSTGKAVGLDMGIKTFAVSSEGMEYINHKYLLEYEKQLAHLQKELSRKKKGSKRWEKARLKLARLHEKIANKRNDMLQKLSTEIIRKYDIICIEDLAPSNMVKNHRLAKHISDAAWSEFRRQLIYKAEWYGKRIVIIDRFYPSSQLCSNCGAKWEGTKDLSVREWTCPVCDKVHDRDVNAAINILNEGLRQLT